MNKHIHELRLASQIKVTDDFKINPEVIKVDNQPIGSMGNISCSLGRAKAKKSFNVSAIVAAALKGKDNVLNYSVAMPEGKRILYVDTEQSPHHCLLALRRIIMIAGLSLDIHPDMLEFLSLRKFTSQERIAIIQDAIMNTKNLLLVIVDGLRDLANDINDSSQANEIISLLMRWSENYQLHIHCVLHQNKGDLNARGHLGTELVNKSETVMEVAKDGDTDRSIVRPLFCRNKEFASFAFSINDEGLPQLDESYLPDNLDSKQKFSYDELSAEQHRNILLSVFSTSGKLNYSKLIEKLKEQYSKYLPNGIGDNKAKSLKLFLENKRMILKEEKLYKFHPEFVF